MKILVRHGDAANQDGKFHGITNNGLTSKGKIAVYDLAKRLKGYGASKIVTDDLPRSKQTAQILGSELDLPIELNNNLYPLNLGNFVGKDVNSNLNEVRYYLNHPNEQIPNGEKVNDWAKKFLGFVNGQLGNVINVTHGRNIVLAKAAEGHDNNQYDKSMLVNNDQSTRHAGYAVMHDDGTVQLMDTKKVKKGQS